MAKRTRKRVQNDKDHSGCMWGFINIFDFRHGRPTHKLLADRKRGSRRIAGELNKAEDSCEICTDVIAGEQYETSTLDKLSVKSLMEEEMFEQRVHSDLGHGRKRSWHANKNSFDLNDVHFVSEKPTHRKHKSLSSLDVTGMMEELCSHVRVKKGNSCLNHEQTSKDSSLAEERLGEATRVFMRHFMEGRNTEEGKTQPSGELVEALHILNSNKNMFLKLLRDPSSELVKHLEQLEDSPLENSGSDLIDQGKSNTQSFFRRRFKGLDRASSKKSGTIVVLEPQNAAMQSARDIRSGDQDDERGSSRFSLTEFTRKLKLAMRKERAHMDNVDNEENLGMASPIEELPKSSVTVNNVDKSGKSRGSGSTPEQRISTIYTEAKKHLAEIVGNSDVDVGFLSKDPESLGRILSYSEYKSSLSCSPLGKESESGNETAAHPVLEENSCDSGNNKCITSEETRNDLEVPKDECSSPLHSVADEIHAEVIKSPDDVETENQILNELVEETPNDSEEEQTLELNLDNVVKNRPSSPLASSSSLSVCSRTEEFEDLEALIDRSERPSPISVLEPIFVEDDVSPPRIKSFSVSELIQPRQIKFEDQALRAPRTRTWAEEKNAVFEFVEAVVRVSGLTHDQLLERLLFSEHLLDPSLFEHVCFCPDRLGYYDPNLLFDLVDDVLTEVCVRDFDGMPSLYHPYIRMKLSRKSLADEIRQGVDWHLVSEHTKRTLDQTVAKDFSKPWTWMDLRLDSESIGVDMVEEIFDELVEEAVTSFVSWDSEI